MFNFLFVVKKQQQQQNFSFDPDSHTLILFDWVNHQNLTRDIMGNTFNVVNASNAFSFSNKGLFFPDNSTAEYLQIDSSILQRINGTQKIYTAEAFVTPTKAWSSSSACPVLWTLTSNASTWRVSTIACGCDLKWDLSHYSEEHFSSISYEINKTWHIAITNDGTINKLYVNGVYSASSTRQVSLEDLYIGTCPKDSRYVNYNYIGYYHSFRLSDVVRYTSDFADKLDLAHYTFK